MSGNQASGLKDLERDYEEILDENCRVYAKYFREVLQNKDRNRLIGPPSVVLQIRGGEKSDCHEDKKIKREFSLKNGRQYGLKEINLLNPTAATPKAYPSFLLFSLKESLQKSSEDKHYQENPYHHLIITLILSLSPFRTTTLVAHVHQILKPSKTNKRKRTKKWHRSTLGRARLGNKNGPLL